MSRIDDALNRANALADRPDDIARRPSVATHQEVLEQYPRERAAQRLEEREAEPRAVSVPVRDVEPPRGVRTTAARQDAAFEGRLILNPSAESLAVAKEQYRRLAAALHDLQVQHGLATLMVTSALPQEGKTLTLSNLALTLSESYGRSVIVIDADLRRPGIHKVFGVPGSVGLVEALHGQGTTPALLRVSPLLSVLPAGRAGSDSMAWLASDRLPSLVRDLSSACNWLLIDAPPVGLLPDAQLLARSVDGVVFVVRAGATPYRLVQRAVEQIGRERIVGAVLNRADERQIPETQYYTRYYSDGAAV